MGDGVRYYGVSVCLPHWDSDEYRHFVNPDGSICRKERPTDFEERLPEDRKLCGFIRPIQDNPSVVTFISYEFSKHPDGLSLDEILSITREAYKLGVVRFTLKGARRLCNTSVNSA